MSKLSITIDGHPLDLLNTTSLTLRLQNPAVLKNNNTVLPGSFSLPFTAPLTTRNKQLLQLPNQMASRPFPLFQGAESELIFDGIPILKGKLYCGKADERSVSLYMIINSMQDLKDISLKSIPLGDPVDISAGPSEHAKDTALNPDNYNHIFFPVSNQGFWDEVDTEVYSKPGGFGSFTVGWNYQNFWDLSSQSFPQSDDHPAAMPFIKTNYLVKKIIKSLQLDLVNEFNEEGELKNLCLYNNYSIYEGSVWSDIMNYANHVPDIPAGDFIKKFTSLFAIGFFPSIFSNQVFLKTLRSVITSSPAVDWTGKSHYSKEIQFNQFPVRSLSFDSDYAEDLRVSYSNAYAPFVPNEFFKVQNMAEFEDATDPGYYYIVTRNLMRYKYPNGLPGAFFHVFLPFLDESVETGLEFESSLIPAQNMWLSTSLNSGIQWNTPRVNNPGTSPDFDISNDPPLRLLLYRGMHQASNGNLYPMSNANVYDLDENKIAEKSLLWNEEEGLYNTFHKEWHKIQVKQKSLTRSYNLTIPDLLKFSFDKLVYDKNQSYLVQELQISITPQGLAPSLVKLIKV